MRILDNGSNRPLEEVTLYLTRAEAAQLAGYLQDMLTSGEHHSHLNDDEYARQMTVAIYTDENLNEFDERSRRLIAEGL